MNGDRYFYDDYPQMDKQIEHGRLRAKHRREDHAETRMDRNDHPACTGLGCPLCDVDDAAAANDGRAMGILIDPAMQNAAP